MLWKTAGKDGHKDSENMEKFFDKTYFMVYTIRYTADILLKMKQLPKFEYNLQ